MRGVKGKRSRLGLRMSRAEITELRAMAKLADVTVSQLVSVIIVLEIQRHRIAAAKKGKR